MEEFVEEQQYQAENGKRKASDLRGRAGEKGREREGEEEKNGRGSRKGTVGGMEVEERGKR